MTGVVLEAFRLGAKNWDLTQLDLSEDGRELLTSLCLEWPDLVAFWTKLTEHVTSCWLADLGDTKVPLLVHAMREGLLAVERADTVRSERRFGIFVNEILFVVSAYLSGHVAVVGLDERWTADRPESFGAWLGRVDVGSVAVLRQPASRQRRGEIAQFLFYRLLEPRVRAIVWPWVAQAMGPPGGRMR